MKFYQNQYNYFLVFVTLLVLFPAFAPVLMYLGLENMAKVIYFVYSFTCHQFDSRSLHLFDYQFAWCARDTAIWLGFAITSWYIKFKDIKALSFYWLIPFVIPIAMDGGIQTIYTLLDVSPTGLSAGEPLYISSNLSRFLTGGIFGIGLALTFVPTLKNTILNKNLKLKIINLKQVSFLFIAIFFSYIFFIQAWNLTSKKYKPEGYLDFVVRNPEKDFFLRRSHAVCPVNPVDYSFADFADNFLALDCFF
ncbi:MAG: hypothetical protein KatS3mg085_841 [Candidatus Dojkabacteria bacterium]|nr:MAG: hypothetical protein KatS3mg085_841 [Candidatus Dojkabacteria bacterium]